MSRYGGCAGQLVMEFPTNKKQQETIGACSKEPTVGLLYDDKDNDRVERFKYSFPEIHCIIIGMNSEKKIREGNRLYIGVYFAGKYEKCRIFGSIFEYIREKRQKSMRNYHR